MIATLLVAASAHGNHANGARVTGFLVLPLAFAIFVQSTIPTNRSMRFIRENPRRYVWASGTFLVLGIALLIL